jgi:hypothetical protein
MKWSDVKEADLNGALAEVKYGHDPVAARSLIEYFHERFREGLPYNERVLFEFLSHAFEKIIENGWTADHAFGLELKRGHFERPDTTERDIIAAAHVILLMRQNRTWQDAKGETANLLFPDGRGDKAVEAAYAFYKDALSHYPDELLTQMVQAGTPFISRDMNG